MTEGLLQKRILAKARTDYKCDLGKIVDCLLVKEDFLTIVEEMKTDFYLAIKHLEHLKIKSPYLESIIEKWLGTK